MCRGLAIGMDKNLNVVCEGKSSHTDSGMDNGGYLKLELIIDDSKPEGYCLEVDENTNDTEGFECYLTKQGKLKKDTEKYILKEIKKDESKYLRWLLQNMTYARGKEDQYGSSWEAEKDQEATFWKSGQDQDASLWKSGENQYANDWEAGRDQYAHRWEAGENQYARGWEAGQDQDANRWKAKKDQYGSSWEAGETQYREHNKAKRIIVSYTETQNEDNNEFIEMLSNKAENNELDWDYLVKLARKGYYGDE